MGHRRYTGYATVVLILLFCSQLLLHAKELTLKEFIAQAKAQNLKIKSSAYDAETKKYHYYQSISAFLPKASASANFIYSDALEETLQNASDNPGSLDALLAQAQRNPFWGREVSISLPIFIGGTRVVDLLLRSQNKTLSELEYDYILQSKIAESVSLFIEAFIAQENLRVALIGQQLAEKNYKNAQHLFDAGRITQLSLLNFKLNFENRKQETILSKLQLNNKISQMSSFVNSEINVSRLVLDPSEFPADFFDDHEYGEAVASLKKVMMSDSPIIKQIKSIRSVADLGIWMSITPFLPAVQFQYTHDFGNAEGLFKDTYAQPDDTFLVTFGINLFNGLSDGIGYKKAKLEYLKTELTLTDTENTQKYLLKTVLSSIYTNLEQQRTARLSKKISEQALSQSRIMFKEGKATYLELLRAETNFINAQKNEIQLEGYILNSYYQLLVLLGTEELR